MNSINRKLTKGTKSDPPIFPKLPKEAIKDIGNIRPGEVKYTATCKQIFTELKSQIGSLEETYKSELAGLKV